MGGVVGSSALWSCSYGCLSLPLHAICSLYTILALKSAAGSNLTVKQHRYIRVSLGWGVIRNSASPASPNQQQLPQNLKPTAKPTVQTTIPTPESTVNINADHKFYRQ